MLNGEEIKKKAKKKEVKKLADMEGETESSLFYTTNKN